MISLEDEHDVQSNEPHFSLEQQHALELAADLDNRIVGITGGAGTGKTLVLGALYKELMKQGSTILCAPTGRAAKRIEELTKIKALTLHRLLEFPTPEDGDDAPMNEPRRNKHYRLDYRNVIVDEASMVPPSLYKQLLEALPNNGCVRFFGDNNQLPPVESGMPPFVLVLREFPSVELTYNFRSDDAIVSNAMNILQGLMPQRNGRFEIVYTASPQRALLEYTTPEFMTLRYQIIMPTRKGKHGTLAINPSLQLRLNKAAPEYIDLQRFDEKEKDLTIRTGDKVIWVKNDYKLNLFNGEMGNITGIEEEDGTLEFSAVDRQVIVPPRVRAYNPQAGHVVTYDPRKCIELGYAVTTHKSQGSEFETIIYCIASANAYLLNRRNFYTAVTRAKKNVIILCDRKAMHLSLRKHQV